jgi:hypothetical protein
VSRLGDVEGVSGLGNAEDSQGVKDGLTNSLDVDEQLPPRLRHQRGHLDVSGAELACKVRFSVRGWGQARRAYCAIRVICTATICQSPYGRAQTVVTP